MIVDLGVIGSHVSCPLFPPSCGVINGVETPFFFGNRRQTCRRSTHCCTTNTRMSKYEVLGVSRFASFQEIKSAYQAAALATHPDKQARIAAGALKKEASKRFLLVQEAWETLRDNDFREEYDCRLDLQAGNVVISDEVRLDEMIFDDTDGGSFSHECRCGEVYAVTSAELREGFEVLDCRGCSLYIRVLGTPEETSTPLAAAGR